MSLELFSRERDSINNSLELLESIIALQYAPKIRYLAIGIIRQL
jgi:hypothetical protein